MAKSHRGHVDGDEYAWRDGWYFRRLADGAVRLRHEGAHVGDRVIVLEADIPPADWAAIIQHVSEPAPPPPEHIIPPPPRRRARVPRK